MTPLPTACRYCPHAEREHMQRWAPPSKGAPGWHTWTAPTDEQRLARMRARRTQAQETR